MQPRRVKMSWPDLGVSAHFDLAVSENPELTAEYWDALPYETVQEHGAVTGKLIYSWARLVSRAPVRVQARHLSSPEGQVSYSQFTGNKVIIKYGELTEDIDAPVLGLVPREDLDTIAAVGDRVWRGYHGTKPILRVLFEKAGTLEEAR